jgi:hypothetical protein
MFGEQAVGDKMNREKQVCSLARRKRKHSRRVGVRRKRIKNRSKEGAKQKRKMSPNAGRQHHHARI